MISSEIAKGVSRTCKFRASKLRSQKSNPAPLDPKDGVVISGAKPERNSGTGASIQTSAPVMRISSSLSDGCSHPIINGGADAQVKPKQSVSRYANPPAIELQGDTWFLS